MLSEDYLGSFLSIVGEVRATESGPKPRDHSEPSLETEKIILIYSRLRMYKWRMEVILLVNCNNQWVVYMFMP